MECLFFGQKKYVIIIIRPFFLFLFLFFFLSSSFASFVALQEARYMQPIKSSLGFARRSMDGKQEHESG